MSDKHTILLQEYQSAVSQIIHWDSLFWTKSRFFLVIESAFIAVILHTFKEIVVVPQEELLPTFLSLLVFVGLLNVYLCYVWFRTNRRNREYLRLRFERVRPIEGEFDEVLKTFTYQEENMHEGHGSAGWETHLPTVFIATWVGLVAVAAVYIF